MHHYHTWSTDLLLKELEELPAPCVVVAHGLSGYPQPEYKDYYEWVARRIPKLKATVGQSVLLDDTAFARAHGLQLPHIIANGVDTEEWATPATGVRSRWGLVGHPWLVNVSNHNPNKGHERLWQVADRVRRLDPGAVVTIIGGTHPAARFDLGRIGVIGGCWYRCLAKSVHQRGVQLKRGVSRSDVVSAVKEADVFLLTSRWEAYPVSLLESMAAGTPWVSFDVGCVREYKGGVIVGDIEEMAVVTDEILRRPELRAALSEAGVAEIKAKHNWSDIAKQYESLYLECVSRKL
jgi:glycosyltransferase involved in cell wall biosynthesis